MRESTTNTTKIAVLQTNMENIEKKVDEICATQTKGFEEMSSKIDKGFEDIKAELGQYVRKEEFAPVKSIAYGIVTLVLTAVISSLLFLVVK